MPLLSTTEAASWVGADSIIVSWDFKKYYYAIYVVLPCKYDEVDPENHLSFYSTLQVQYLATGSFPSLVASLITKMLHIHINDLCITVMIIAVIIMTTMVIMWGAVFS